MELFKMLREDRELYQVYQANIAMAFKDTIYWRGNYDKTMNKYIMTPGELHETANEAAKYFLDLLIKPTEK